MMIKGVYTLLMTPFTKDFALDEAGLRVLVRRQIEGGVHGLAPLGVTGENPSLNENEIDRMVEITVEEAGGKAKVAPDTCTNNLEQTIARARRFAEIGADYVVVFAPFLVLPNQAGLLDFYRRVADACPVPIVIHNAPERVGVNVEPKTYAKLMDHGNIAGTKDGKKELDHLAKLIHLARGKNFEIFTGKDTTAYPLMAFGGSGMFSVTANILPGVMRELTDHSLAGRHEEARSLHYAYYDLFAALRLETNPMAVKAALSLLGLPGGPLRPPLSELGDGNREYIRSLLKERGLL
ncbi:MAG: 4-hydroxy-tetrahydrodipicolinate synthase [Acidobacteriota bacterium]|jgi:4-hydroxy-tetrahydrodipicolinate synthase|nr:4-hydroxy-tetrahydrodipicolinate synthase [Acidobacteriota bacterium]OQB57602.1 MAG: 4-hydroxy-tetrahydrodipicolinate synthase [Candidatus Aminicenantes bacterium ADurb.Bin147]HNQ80211.1 4-hydroxy-tetrahydrodipicolinate synthase [Candidatus Aminicenantes bacterium]MDD8010749.1 4-hydroxy-tetrahydrodipicolinate synthase [Acidobacteriota bacterium]MDD8028558.1 4-hydroxy-tetrahydrodipicolinate synthase [Acidobacteriota bacterium]